MLSRDGAKAPRWFESITFRHDNEARRCAGFSLSGASMKNLRPLLAWLIVACCIALLALTPDPFYPANPGNNTAGPIAETTHRDARVGFRALDT